MRQIGIAEAKAHLSQVLRDVQAGAEWMITDRGKPVARIVPVEFSTLSLDERLTILEERGIIERRRPFAPFVPLGVSLPDRNMAQRLLMEDRDSGY